MPILLLVLCLVVAVPTLAGQTGEQKSMSQEVDLPSEDEAVLIARDAYVFFYPMLQNYRTMVASKMLAGRPFNEMRHRSHLLDPSFTAIVGPNNDTLYSSAWLDLSQGPVIIDVPPVPNDRYYSVQLIDLFTHNFAYIGKRATGSDGGRYAIVSANWQGEVPDVEEVFVAESDIVYAIGRILAANQDDLEVAVKLQRQFRVDHSVAAPGSIELPSFGAAERESHLFIPLVNQLLRFVHPDPEELDQYERFCRIGICLKGTALKSQPDWLEQAVDAGVETALADIERKTLEIGEKVNGWDTTFNAFGDRETLRGQYLVRAAVAKVALYGNSKQENNSFVMRVDATGQPLSGQSRYRLTFAPGQLPPTNAFWSITMYRMPEVLLVENPIERYSIGDRTPGLQRSSEGALAIYLQHDRPSDPQAQSNWLPAPRGNFAIALRIYLPDSAVYEGKWLPPQLVKLP